jgi:hypothetical protein
VTNANEKQSPHRLEVTCPPFGAYWRKTRMKNNEEITHYAIQNKLVD